MFGTIRKHQTWLWVFIIAITILGMIIWTNQGGSGNQRAKGNFGSIDGKAITLEEMRQAGNDAQLLYLVQNPRHQWPDNAGAQYDVQRQTYERLFLMRKMDEYNIHPDPELAAQHAALILSQWDDGQGHPITTDELQAILNMKRMTQEDFEHFLERDLGIEQLQAVVGLSGKLLPPQEIESLYVEQYQELAADAVFFSASNQLAKIPNPTPEALGQFYTNQQAAYREPDKMQVSYVFFNVTNFMPQAEQALGTNLNPQVDAAMMRVGTNFARLGKTPEEARTKVREILLQQVAETNAYAKADALEKELAAAKGTNQLENLMTIAKEKGLEVKVTKPFDKEYGPSDINLGQYPVESLFQLTPDEPLTGAIRGADGVYVLALKGFIPSRVPPLSEIRSRVEEDYKFRQALNLAQVNGRSFAQTVTNEMAHGKTFAQTADATRVTPVKLPPFSQATTRLPEVEDHVDLNEFKNVAFGTPVGSVSRFMETPDGGFVVHVRQRLPVDTAKMKTQLPEFTTTVRQRRETEAFYIWFGGEWNKAAREIPALQRQEQQ